MADKKKKEYGMNVDFNSYGLKPADIEFVCSKVKEFFGK